MNQRRTEEQLAELANTCFSDFLLEKSHGYAPDRWKGMTKEELDRIRQEQLRQIDEGQVVALIDQALDRFSLFCPF